ncbi:MAG TPA: C4-dicarboxylate transporter DctA [Opitutaceae bacterium]|nr:C4-dicarboxylate transporter DctA [Opitutaceae bacterium]
MKRLAASLYAQVVLGILIGGVLGWARPDWGVALRPLGDAFVNLVRMLIGPIIFTTVVAGIAGMGDLRKVGRVGVKALVYFEIVTTFALVIGLVVANGLKPGAGFHATAAQLDGRGLETFTDGARHLSATGYLLHIIPTTIVGAFIDGDILQVLLIAILTGCALGQLGDHGRAVLNLVHDLARVFYGMVRIVTRGAPIAAAGAMAFMIGQYGMARLEQLGFLLACVYLSCGLFITVVLGVIARCAGFSLWRIIRHIREELMLVLSTSSSETALPGLMDKLERAGCGRGTVGIVVPAGYSFNLDGTCIYLTLAALFLAQATDTPLSLGEQLRLVAVLLLTSKGAAGVTGSGFIVLAATLASTGRIPVAAMALILGVDRFMSEARALTNFIGNSVATLVIAKWNGDFDPRRAGAVLGGRPPEATAGLAGLTPPPRAARAEPGRFASALPPEPAMVPRQNH